MGIPLALAIGAAIGALARAFLPGVAPRRLDVAIILAAVGAMCAALTASVLDVAPLAEASPGSALRAAAGAVAILLAFVLVPRVAPGVGRMARPLPRD